MMFMLCMLKALTPFIIAGIGTGIVYLVWEVHTHE
jgi:hypothetical protein